MLDGSDAAKKEERNALFAVSELRGKYPQVFKVVGDKMTFLGDYEGMESLVECNETLQTFDKAFADVAKTE